MSDEKDKKDLDQNKSEQNNNGASNKDDYPKNIKKSLL